MCKKPLLFLFLLFMAFYGRAQKFTLAGQLFDEEKKPVLYATVSLLSPQDSTLLHYGISNDKGYFEIRNIEPGRYLLQSAAFGYKTISKKINVSKDSSCIVLMELLGVNLNEVEIIADNVPILIKKDTIEYNAGAFKTRPDATAEELLKKLPGVEVDRAGNVKAQGENVSKVLVDGKEFFGDDPKVATKNLPADAVKKVQVYDKKSDETELTGIDDGSHEKVVNLVLKDGKKSAVMGDVMAGYGTDDHYQAAAKVYRFKQKSQFAALGMLNNVNQFGFTFSDYLSFTGGLRSLSSGDGLGSLISNNNMPVNSGQPVTGLVTSGAGGLNYTFEKSKGNRFNVSYMGNGSEKKLDETLYSQNFSTGNAFEKYDTTYDKTRNQGHNVQMNWRARLDSTQNLTFIANGFYGANKQFSQNKSYTWTGGEEINRATYLSDTRGDEMSGNANLSYLKKLHSRWRLFKIAAEGSFENNHSDTRYNNTIGFKGFSFVQNPFQNNSNVLMRGSARTSFTRRLGNGFYLEPELQAGINNDAMNRQQGFFSGSAEAIDSLSPAFESQYLYGRPALRLKKNTDKTDIEIGARVEMGQLQNSLNDQVINNSDYFYVVPSVRWELQYQRQKNVGLGYNAYVRTPSAYQMLPVVNNLNPLQVFKGNAGLKPEYIHQANARWWIFDQFSMTSFFLGLNGRYTKDKISFARNIFPNLAQELTLVNVPEDYVVDANMNLSTPVRALKINFVLGLKETWNKGISLVNAVKNTNTNLTHEASVSVNNRKKDKWDVNVGASIRYTDARYSLQASLNNVYYQYNYFSEISYSPSDRINFFVSADLATYDGSNFKNSVSIPLLKAEVKYYFLKGKRGILSLEAFDLLNKNTGLQRSSELNYIMERQSSIIRQYFMLSFKFKLNKFDMNEGLKIDIKR